MSYRSPQGILAASGELSRISLGTASVRLLSSPGFGIYAAHAAFWGAFVITRLTVQTRDQQEQGGKASEARASTAESAAHSRVLVAVHGLAFVVLYIGLGIAVLGGHSVALFRSQPIAALAVIGAGAALCCCALLYLRSWRFRAAVSVGHELATGGPFRFVRHPIYMGLNLLALGSALWIPTPIVWLSFVLMCIGGDLRARAEEALLVRTYGRTYQSYCTRTRRFLPGLY